MKVFIIILRAILIFTIIPLTYIVIIFKIQHWQTPWPFFGVIAVLGLILAGSFKIKIHN